ncbi:hypothetical protein GGU11DRAFT_284578 [Lentinula aff. detonsa]|nr:hypothetical protein GGU11DRAFT_284578 [Lentinula aff. detonsa]
MYYMQYLNSQIPLLFVRSLNRIVSNPPPARAAQVADLQPLITAAQTTLFLTRTKPMTIPQAGVTRTRSHSNMQIECHCDYFVRLSDSQRCSRPRLGLCRGKQSLIELLTMLNSMNTLFSVYSKFADTYVFLSRFLTATNSFLYKTASERSCVEYICSNPSSTSILGFACGSDALCKRQIRACYKYQSKKCEQDTTSKPTKKPCWQTVLHLHRVQRR